MQKLLFFLLLPLFHGQLEIARGRLEKAQVYVAEGKLAEAEAELQKLLAVEVRDGDAQLNAYRAAAFRQLGGIYVQQKKIPEALAAFENTLKLNANDSAVHYQLGMLLLGSQQNQPAVVHLRKAYALGLKNASVLLNLARAEFTQGQATEALGRIDEILAAKPQSDSLFYQLGVLLFEHLFYKRAEEMLRTAQALNPNSYEIDFYLGLLNFLLEKYDLARDVLTGLIERGFTTVDLYSLLGAVHANLGDFERAVSVLEKGISLGPNRYDAQLNLALVYLQRKEIERAEALLEKAARTTADRQIKVFFQLGKSSCGDLLAESAQPDLNAKSDPTKADFYFNLAVLFQNRHHHTTALELLKIARKYEPASARIYFALAFSCLNLEPSSRAPAVLFRKVVELEPTMDQGFYFLGEAYARLNDSEEALSAYQKAIALNSKQHLYHFALAKILAEGNRSEESVKSFQRAIGLNPAHAASYYELGKLYIRIGKAEPAIAMLEKAVELAPEFYEAYYLLGRAHAKIQHTEKAKELFAIFEAKKKIAGERATAKGGFTRANE